METNDLLKCTLTDESRKQRCNPYPEHIDRHAQVVKELKERDENDKIQDREVVKRSLESGQPDVRLKGLILSLSVLCL